jgi:hypothetical protein
MGKALEVISGRVTAPGAAFTAWTMAAGNSLTVRNANIDTRIQLLQIWADNQAAGVLRVRSAKLHDNVQGIRLDVTISEVQPLLAWGAPQRLISQDVLVAEQTGSAVAGDIENGAMLIYYPDLPGNDARLATWEEIARRGQNIVTVENTITTGAGGGYTGEEALNAEFDLLKANTDYALLGYLVDTECCVVRWRGADSANLGVGGPGHEALRHKTANWFKDLAMDYGLPLIPVFNSANRSGILVDAVQDENAAAVTLTSIFAELGVSTAPGTPGR